MTVTVTNTGDTYSGKEVVQVYFSAPEGSMEKAYQELIAYGKTDNLAPGESQTLNITFLTTEMSSYSEEKAAYILEKGDYILRVGNSSRNTTPAAVLSLDQDVITEQLSNQVPAAEPIEELNRKDVASYTDGKNTDHAVKISLTADTFETIHLASKVDNENVNVYVSDTTEEEYLAENTKAQLYNPYTDKTYSENVVRLDGDFSNATLLDVYNGTVTTEEFVSSLSLTEMAALIEGVGNTWGEHFECPVEGAVGFTTPILKDRLIPQISLDDGASGLSLIREYYTDAEGNWIGMKEQDGGWGSALKPDKETLENEYPGYVTWYQYPTQFGSSTTLAQTWNLDLAYAFGKAVGEEMNEFNVDILLAPSLNIHTNPLGGRNFEYYSEDPVVSGLTALVQTRGVQSMPGAGVSLKHFAANNQETNRNSENNIISERAFREIYLKGFEIAVRGAAPMTVMTSYNVNNNVPASNDYDMLEDILRGEWGFDGLVETDWGGSGGYTIPMAMHTGNDLIMPGGSSGETIVSAIADIPTSFKQPVYDISKDEAGGYIIADTGEIIDTGYPSVQVSSWWGIMKATPLWNDFVPAADGVLKIEKEVSLESYETQNIPQIKDDEIFFASLKELVENDESVDVEINGDTVKVTYHGNYAPNTLSLGDVQKSAIHILNVMKDTGAFEQYSGETAPSYTEKRADRLVDYYSIEKN